MIGDHHSSVRLEKWKWSLADGRCAPAFSRPVRQLGRDEHGVWLGAQRGNPVLQPDGRTEEQQHDAVWLIPTKGWWLAAFWFTDTTDLTVDVCQPATRDGDSWSFVDLELDLYRDAAGRAGIVDQDEFADLAATGWVSEQDLATASAAADALLPLIEQRTEPFGDTGRRWLGRLRDT